METLGLVKVLAGIGRTTTDADEHSNEGGFPAVTSTTGADTFLREWAAQFKGIRQVFVCFNRSLAGDAAAANVQRMLPKARAARLPADVGDGGTVFDFFIGLERTPLDFEIVLAAAAATGEERPGRPHVLEFRAVHPSLQHRAERVRAAVPLHETFVECEAVPGSAPGWRGES